MKKNQISVIVPIYNVRPWLCRCVESILRQTYSLLEIILVDDGSTDGSEKICDEYAAQDKRVRVIHKENGGLVTARKAGLAAADGEYVGFVDADDYIDSDFYELLYHEIKEKNVDFVQCGALLEDGCHTVSRSMQAQTVEAADKKEVMVCFLRSVWDIPCSQYIWNKLFGRDFIRKCYAAVPDFQQYGEDFLTICEALLRCKAFSVIDNTKYHYIVREDSMSRAPSFRGLGGVCSFYMLLERKLKKENVFTPEVENLWERLFKRAVRDHYNRLLGNMRPPLYSVPQIEKLVGKRIALYGAGCVGRDYYRQLALYQQITIAAWIDKRAGEISCEYAQIRSLEALADLEYDVLLIAVEKEEIARKIKEELTVLGVQEHRLLWEKPSVIEI